MIGLAVIVVWPQPDSLRCLTTCARACAARKSILTPSMNVKITWTVGVTTPIIFARGVVGAQNLGAKWMTCIKKGYKFLVGQKCWPCRDSNHPDFETHCRTDASRNTCILKYELGSLTECLALVLFISAKTTTTLIFPHFNFNTAKRRASSNCLSELSKDIFRNLAQESHTISRYRHSYNPKAMDILI